MRRSDIIDLVKPYSLRTGGNIGGFTGLVSDDISISCDSVGTKSLLALDYKQYETIGYDMVAINVNDVIASGRVPSHFMNYIACHKIDKDVINGVMEGIVKACNECDIKMIGGETAEIPRLYQPGKYDFLGIVVGDKKFWSHEYREHGNDDTAGRKIIGLRSSGFHANGFNYLLDKLKEKNEIDLNKVPFQEINNDKIWEILLKPTRMYHNLIDLPKLTLRIISGMTHISGEGWNSLNRMIDKDNETIKWRFVDPQTNHLEIMTGWLDRICDGNNYYSAGPDYYSAGEDSIDLRNIFNYGYGFGIAVLKPMRGFHYNVSESVLVTGLKDCCSEYCPEIIAETFYSD